MSRILFCYSVLEAVGGERFESAIGGPYWMREVISRTRAIVPHDAAPLHYLLDVTREEKMIAPLRP